MIVITVARKPLSPGLSVARNSLAHGTGGINIDATRIEFSATEPDSGMNFYRLRNQNMPENRTNYFRGQDGIVRSRPPTGRWPANLILQHLPGCQQSGTKTVPGYMINRWDDGAKPFGGGAGHAYTTAKKAEPEQVETWICEPGCPVAALDQQSGERPGMSGGGATADNVNKKTGAEVIPSFNRKPSAPFIRSDTGGASRFFKQVRDPKC